VDGTPIKTPYPISCACRLVAVLEQTLKAWSRTGKACLPKYEQSRGRSADLKTFPSLHRGWVFNVVEVIACFKMLFCTHSHSCTRVHAHTHVHTNIHTTQRHTRANACVHTQTHTHVRTHTHTNTHTHTIHCSLRMPRGRSHRHPTPSPSLRPQSTCSEKSPERCAPLVKDVFAKMCICGLPGPLVMRVQDMKGEGQR
jgi:hypothetical protein